MGIWYSGGGDWGETGLADGTRVPKDDPVIVLLGALDELNTQVGVARAFVGTSSPATAQALARVQDQLFVLGAEIAAPGAPSGGVPRLTEADLEEMEREIDRLGRPFGDLRKFVIPSGSLPSAELQLSRAVARRTELAAVAAARRRPIRHELLAYLNRLSSLLFVLAIRVNGEQGWAARAPTYRTVKGGPAAVRWS